MKLLPQLLVLGTLATLGAGLNPSQAQAQPGNTNTLESRLLECRAIESALQRLDCYDEVSRHVTQSQGRSGTAATRRVEEAHQRAEENRAQAEIRRQEARSQAEAAREQAQQNRQRDAERENGTDPSLRTGDDFGREHRRQRGTDEGPHAIEIVEAWQNPHGLWRFRLASGAEWHQLQSGYFDYEEGGSYYIERGMLNSFRLGREGSNRMIRVRRVD